MSDGGVGRTETGEKLRQEGKELGGEGGVNRGGENLQHLKTVNDGLSRGYVLLTETWESQYNVINSVSLLQACVKASNAAILG